MSRFDGKVALVTGAGQGIGAAITRRLAADGAKVIASDISGQQDVLAEELGPNVTGRHLNVADEASVREIEDWIRSEFGGLEILCNNAAALGGGKNIHEYPLEEADKIWAVNIRGAYMVLQASLRLMLDSGGGAVVNTASIGGFRATPQCSAYIISKGAMVMMTRAAALEYATKGIRINAVAPGATRTPPVASAPDEYVKKMVDLVPAGRLGESDEIANVVAFLADDKEASFVTGQIWTIDGGRSAG